MRSSATRSGAATPRIAAANIVELTEAGRKALARAEKGRAVIEDEVLVGLDADEKAALRKLLNQALDAVGRLPAAATEG